MGGKNTSECADQDWAVLCAWTLKWSCPGQPRGTEGVVEVNKSDHGSRCCCEYGHWLEVPGVSRAPAGASLFCFSVVTPGGAEEVLIQEQYKRGVSIFGCDQYEVLSTDKVQLGDSVSSKAIEHTVAKSDSWHNNEMFVRAWEQLLEQGSLLKHDWVVKVDPDAVFFPDRLVDHLQPYLGSAASIAQYLANCNVPAGTSKIYGALEVFSRRAMELYRESSPKCKEPLANWRELGEDNYMQSCMDLLGAENVAAFDLVGDLRCNFAPCTDGSRAAFHAFKDVDSYLDCLQQAGG